MTDAAKSGWRRKLLIFLFIFIILNAVLLSLSDPIIRWFAQRYLGDIGVSAKIEDVRLNLIDSQLSIINFTTTDEKNRRLSLARLDIDWQWQGITSGLYTVNSVKAQGLRLDLAFNGGLKSIGPLELSVFANAEPAPKDREEPPSTPWQLALGNIELSDFDVCLSHFDIKYLECAQWSLLKLATQLKVDSSGEYQFNGDVTLDKFTAKDIADLDDLSLSGLAVTNAEVNWQSVQLQSFTFKVPNDQGSMTVSGLNLSNGRLLPDSMTGFLSGINLDGIELYAGIFIGNADGFEVGRLELAEQNQLALDVFKLQSVKFGQKEHPMLETQKLKVNDIQLDTQQQRVQINEMDVGKTHLSYESRRSFMNREEPFDSLLYFDQLKASGINASANEQLLTSLQISGVGALEDLQLNDGTMLVNLKELMVNSISRDKDIRLGTVSLDGLVTSIEQSPEDGLNLANWFYEKPENQRDEDEKVEKAAPPEIYIDQFRLTGDSKVAFTEHTLGQPHVHQLNDVKVEISDIAVAKQSKSANVDISAKIAAGGEIEVKGQLTPAPDALASALKGRVKFLELPPLSPYSARHIGYRVDQGQINVDFNVDIADNQIDSKFDLHLNKFEIGALENHEQSAVNAQLGVPLPTALNLLRDSDNNIELSIPVKGDLDSPDFSASDVMSKVTYKALKSAILYTYSPLGMLSVANDLVDLATALRFKPVEFSAGQLTLTDEAKARMENAAKVLKEKPKVSLVLCANATKADLAPETPFTEELLPSLLDNAKARQQAVQGYLVVTHGIEAHRLLLCNIKLDKKADAKPKVEISI